MEEPLKICNALLLELVSRWSADNKSFRIREHLVPFKIFDVCVVLGLSVRGQDVSFDSCTAGLVNNLFDNEDITIKKIFLKLQEEDNVDNYCRLYSNCQCTEIRGYPCFVDGIPHITSWRLSAVRPFWHSKFLCPSHTIF